MISANTDPHSHFITRLLRKLTNDPYIETRISWNAEFYCYNFNIYTSHSILTFKLGTNTSAREWPPPVEVLEAAVAKFEALYPELLL